MTDTDRARLAAILGMLGSAHAGERAAAALQAEAFRRKHGLTWGEVLGAAAPVAGLSEPEMPTVWPPYEPIQWHKVAFLACFWTAVILGAFAVH